MTKNTYNQLKFALKEKGFWTPADERRPAKDAKMEIPVVGSVGPAQEGRCR